MMHFCIIFQYKGTYKHLEEAIAIAMIHKQKASTIKAFHPRFLTVNLIFSEGNAATRKNHIFKSVYSFFCLDVI
jgi:hypothetical protein